MPTQRNTNFTINAPKPIDSRLVKRTFADLATIPIKYDRMKVYVLDPGGSNEDTEWRWFENLNNWVKVDYGQGGITSVGWADITGSPQDSSSLVSYLGSNYAIKNHTHVTSDILPANSLLTWGYSNVAPDFIITGSAPSSGVGGGTIVSWGSIIGTLSNQTDLQTALNLKLDDVTAGTNITIDKTNPRNPVISSTASGGSSGISNQYNQNNLTFTNTTGDYFGTESSPRTGTLTFDMTGAVRGGIAVCYYQDATLDIPATLFTLGQFKANAVNKLYFERDGDGNVTCNIVNDVQTNFITSDTTQAGTGTQLVNIVECTQAEYDALGTPDANTWYFING